MNKKARNVCSASHLAEAPLSLLLTTNAAKDRRSHRKEKERENSDVREGDYEILKMVASRTNVVKSSGTVATVKSRRNSEIASGAHLQPGARVNCTGINQNMSR